MKLSKKLLQAMTMSLTIGAAVATTSSCTSLKENAEITPKSETCTINCGIICLKHDNEMVDYCPPCGRG